MPDQELFNPLVERILTKLELSVHPSADMDGLRSIYGAWCHKVPFDNVRKLVHLSENLSGPLPGDDACDFFAAWLKYGAGGTCWAGNGALQALLVSLGFNAFRGIATMIVAPNLPPNHGTVLVDCEGGRYIVDASILTGVPMRIDQPEPDAVCSPSSVHLSYRDERWHIWWQPLHLPAGIECRIDQFPVTRAEFQQRHEQTRQWSPFNYQLTIRSMRGNAAVGIGAGQWVEIESNALKQRAISLPERDKLLIDTLGIEQELVARLPADRPTPPPPWSETAKRALEQQH